MRREPRKTVRSEHEEQAEFVAWCRMHLPWYGRRVHSVPNERLFKGNKRQRAAQWQALHETGAESGVPDLLIPGATPVGGYPGVAIEMKRTKGSKTSPKQWLWLLHYTALGWKAVRCMGAHEAIEVMRSVGYEER